MSPNARLTSLFSSSLLVLFFVLFALVACQRPDPLDGFYRGTWGPTQVLVAEGRVLARYPRGSLDCTRTNTNDSLDCRWVEGQSKGKAKFSRELDGTLRGTWGRDESYDDGGVWLLMR